MSEPAIKPATQTDIEITIISRQGAAGNPLPLSKSFELQKGEIVKTGGSQAFHHGTMARKKIKDLDDLASIINSLLPNQALTLGRLIPAGDSFEGVVSAKEDLALGRVARTKNNFHFMPGVPAPILIDSDIGKAPEAIKSRLVADYGGDALRALDALLKDLRLGRRVVRRQGLYVVRSCQG